jgi:ATP/maltotriose-dependent transcriptional regulator MalT
MNPTAVASPVNDMAGYPKPPLRRRRILERQRLIRAIDRSRARVRLLVAGAGYGKTTLAEQWAEGQGRRVAWVRARRPSADIAVLVRQVAAAAAEILPGCDRRVIERLNATADPADELGVLVDLLSENLADWPDDGWLVVDDYHHIKESTTAEAFIESVIQQSPVQVLISTRDRPSWISTRSVLYGEVLEIGQSMLAMSEDEVNDLLAGAHEEMSSGLLALAGGWPAVVGLASLTTNDTPLPDEGLDLPYQLYEFFADEVYRGLDTDSRVGLGLLATAPSLDRDLAAELIGAERASRIVGVALGLGVLEERDGKLELHPLAAAFLEERARRETTTDLEVTITRCLAVYRRRFEWDAAFELVERYGTDGDFQSLFAEGLDPLLNAARFATVESLIHRAQARGISSLMIEIARAELALRQGKHLSAQTFAQAALRTADATDGTAWRAAMVAGRAAQTGSREESALDFYRLAERVGQTERAKRDALWGQLMAASALEYDEAGEMLELLESTADHSDPHELVRMADKKLGLDFRSGAVRTMANARAVAELVTQLSDPFARCSFRCAFAYALNLGAHYAEAHEQASLLYDDSTEFRVDPALPYAHSMLAMALGGLSRYRDAHIELDNAARESRRCSDEFGLQSVYAIRLRLLVQEGRAAEAASIEPPDLSHSLRSMRGEVVASRALALASLSRLPESRSLAGEAAEITRGVEARVLVAATEAVCALRGRVNGWRSAVDQLADLAFDAGAVDLVVTAYRGNTDLLEALLSSEGARERTLHMLARSGDESLISEAGIEAAMLTDPVETLSPREREVYVLLCEGLSNSEIASRLFITEGTVKVHVQHVFDKLGVRSRTALAINAARGRRRQSVLDTPDGRPGS